MSEQTDAWLKEATQRLDKKYENTWGDPAGTYGPKSYDYDLLKLLHQKFQELEQRLEAERKARHTLEDRVTGLEARAAAQVERSS